MENNKVNTNCLSYNKGSFKLLSVKAFQAHQIWRKRCETKNLSPF